MNGVELQPLSLGVLLDRAFTLYRRHFWLFAGIMAIPACLYIPVNFFFVRTRRVPYPWSRVPPQPHITALAFGSLFLFWIIYWIAHAAATYAVADTYLGRSSTIRAAYARIRVRFWSVMALFSNVGIRVIGFTVLLIIAGIIPGAILIGILSSGPAAANRFGFLLGICLVGLGLGFAMWFWLRYAVSMPAMLIEGIKGREAIRRSVHLSKGRRGHLFIAVLLSAVLSYTTALVFQGPFYLTIALIGIKGQLPSWLALALAVSASFGAAVTSPLLMIILVLCYYDLRIRKEWFDLQFMLTSLPDSKPAGSASPA